MTPAFYPALFSNPLRCPFLGHFAEAGRGKTGRCQWKNCHQEAGRFPSLPVFFTLLMKLQGAKPFLATVAQKLPNTAFQLLGGIPDATRSTGRPQTGLRRETGAFTILDCGSNQNLQIWAEKILLQKSVAVPWTPLRQVDKHLLRVALIILNAIRPPS